MFVLLRSFILQIDYLDEVGHFTEFAIITVDELKLEITRSELLSGISHGNYIAKFVR